jgi:uncharacterized protein YggE
MNPDNQREIEIRRLIKWGSFVLVMLGIFLVVETMSAYKSFRSQDIAYNSISVTGEGEVYAVPDIASFSYSVAADAPTVTEAQNQVTAKMNAILDEVKNLGVEEKDITTSNYSVYPKYKYSQGVCTNNFCPPSQQIADGFTVSHDITLKVRNTDSAGKVLAAVGSKGATNVSGLNFTTDDPSKIQDQARAKAIADAREKAKTLAKNLDVDLVKIVSFSDNSYPTPYPMYGGVAMDKAVSTQAPTLPVGENKVTSSVTVVYEIR